MHRPTANSGNPLEPLEPLLFWWVLLHFLPPVPFPPSSSPPLLSPPPLSCPSSFVSSSSLLWLAFSCPSASTLWLALAFSPNKNSNMLNLIEKQIIHSFQTQIQYKQENNLLIPEWMVSYWEGTSSNATMAAFCRIKKVLWPAADSVWNRPACWESSRTPMTSPHGCNRKKGQSSRIIPEKIKKKWTENWRVTF